MTFSQSTKVVSRRDEIGPQSLMFIDPGIKVSEICYCGVLLSQKLLSVVCQVSGQFIFQQDR